MNLAIAKEIPIERTKEVATRNLEIQPRYLIELCDDKSSDEWCNGFFSATIISFEVQGLEVCLPRNEVNRYIFDGAWTITKAWLYRQAPESKVSFYEAIKSSLTERSNCNKT
jgi:hypothetical protein